MALPPKTGMFQTFGGLREDDINTDGGGGFGSLEGLGSRSTGPTEPDRTSSINDPVSITDLLDDLPEELPEDPEEPPSPEDTIAQAFAGWEAFIQQVLEYIEDQASDDIDRVYLAQELRELQDLFDQYEAGEITAEQFLEFEPDFIFDVPGATEYWDTLQGNVLGTGEATLSEQLMDAYEQGEEAFQTFIENALPDIDVETIEDLADWIRDNFPEETSTTILEDAIGQGVGVIFDEELWERVRPSNMNYEDWLDLILQGEVYIPGLPVPLPSGSVVLGTLEDLMTDPFGTISDWTQEQWEKFIEALENPTEILSEIFAQGADIPSVLSDLIIGGVVGAASGELLDWLEGILGTDEDSGLIIGSEGEIKDKEEEEAAAEQIKKDARAEQEEKEQDERDKKELGEAEKDEAEDKEKEAAEEAEKEAAEESEKDERTEKDETREKEAEDETKEKEAESEKDAEAEDKEKEEAEEAEKDEQQEKDEKEEKEAETEEKDERTEKEAESEDKEKEAAEEAEKEAEEAAKESEEAEKDEQQDKEGEMQSKDEEDQKEDDERAEKEEDEEEYKDEQDDKEGEGYDKDPEDSDKDPENDDKEGEAFGKDPEDSEKDPESSEKEGEDDDKEGEGDEKDGGGGAGAGMGLGRGRVRQRGIMYNVPEIVAVPFEQKDYMVELNKMIDDSLFSQNLGGLFGDDDDFS